MKSNPLTDLELRALDGLTTLSFMTGVVKVARDRLRFLESENLELLRVIEDAREEWATGECHGAEREREECCRVVCLRCRRGQPLGSEKWAPNLHVGEDGKSVYHCDAYLIRNRGPVRPPLRSEVVEEENRKLRATLRAVIAWDTQAGVGPWSDVMDRVRSALKNE